MKSNLSVLAIDIGNTNINIGLFYSGKLKLKYNISSLIRDKRRLKRHFLNLSHRVRKFSKIIERIIISSVVPNLDKSLRSILGEIFRVRPEFCGRDFIVPIKNLYKRPKSVGQDRLVNAYGALKLYGKPLILIDFGTAVTLDVVSKKGEYLGGIIAPGLNLSLKALSENTALLPKLELVKAQANLNLIGRTTEESIYIGVLLGFSCLAQGLIKQLRKEIGKNVKVIATGGDTRFIKRFLKKSVDIFDEELTLKGLNLL